MQNRIFQQLDIRSKTPKDDFPKDIEAVAEFVRGDEEGATGIKLQGDYGLKKTGRIKDKLKCVRSMLYREF